MPDIKTALETALSKTANAWAADDEAHQQIEPQQEKAMTLTQEQHHHSVTNNVSRTTFNYIRDNPNTSRARIMAELTDKGFKYESVSTLISQMIRCNMVAMGEYDTLTTLVPEYVPIKSSSKPTKVKAVAAPAPRKHVEIVNTRTGEVFNPKPVPEKEWSPSDVIDKLSVRQALALFKELRNILVG